jgi:hypothetical protein
VQVLLATVIPVAIVVAMGYYAGRRFDFDQSTLSKLSIYFLVPALIFDAMYRAQLSGSSVLGLSLAYCLGYVGLFLLSQVLCQVLELKPPEHKALMTMATFPNSGNMGLPMAQFAFGAGGYERAVVVFIVSSVFMFGLWPAYLRGGGLLRGLIMTLRLPLFWSLFVGLGLRYIEGLFPPLSEFIHTFKIDQAIRLLAQACIPIMLVSLGMQIAKTPMPFNSLTRGLHGLSFELLGSILRQLVAPAMALMAGQALRLSTLDLQVLALQCAMSVAVNAFMMVQEFGGDAERTARGVVVSTVLAFITIPLVLAAVGVH